MWFLQATHASATWALTTVELACNGTCSGDYVLNIAPICLE